MATPFRFKRSAVQDKRPEISDLLLGEIALNTYDGRLFGRRTGTGSTVTLLTPWSERLGAAAIYYENNVAIGATNPEGRKLYVDGNVEITGITTFGSDVTFSGTILGTQLLISGISTFQGNVDLDADLDVDGRTELDITNISETLNVTGISTFVGITTQTSTLFANQLNVAGVSTFYNDINIYRTDGSTRDVYFYDQNGGYQGGIVQAGDGGSGRLDINGNYLLRLNSQNDVEITDGQYTTTKRAVFKDGPVELYFGNSAASTKKFETTADGIDVTGHTETDTLNVSGVSTYGGAVDINSTLDVDGDTQLDDLNVAGVATFSSLVDVNNRIDVVGGANVDQFNVSGVSTFGSLVDVNNRIDVVGGLNADQINAGLSSFTQLDVSTGGLDVDGQTDLDELVVAGVSTYSALVDIDNRLDVTGGANIDQLNVTGVTTLTGIVTTGTDLYVGGDLYIADDLVFDEFTARNGNVTGILTVGTTLDADGTLLVTGVSTFNSLVDVNNRIDVIGGINADQVNVSGVSTYGGAVDINSTLDVDGDTQLDDLNVSGVSTFSSLVDVNNRIDVVGGINADQVNVSGISTFDAAVDINSTLDVDGDTQLDDLNVSGVSTFSSLVDINNRVDVIGGVNADQVNVTGVSTFGGNIDADGDLDVDGTTDLDILNVAETATFSALVDVNNRLDVVGGANVDQLNVSGVSTFGSAVDINSTIDISGQAEFDDVNISGVATISTLEVTQATTLKHADSVKFTTTGIGISVANGVGQTAYIEGPEEIWIDPHPVGVATTSGIVRIRGDLYVDGRNFIVNSDTIELADFVVGIASTVPTNLLLDGAGIGIGSESIRKFIRWHNATDSLKTTENWNLASGKHYEIDGIDVLTSDTLGSGVLYSSLETLGVLRGLDVSGVSTFSSLVDVNNRIDVVGGINVDQANVTGVSTFGGNITASGDLDVDGTTDLDILNVAETATFSALVDVNNRIDIVGGANIDQVNAGLSSFTQLDVSTGGLDVDGQTDLDELVVAGVSTFSSLVDVNNRIDVVGGANVDQLNVSGVSTFTGISTFASDVFVDGDLNVTGDLVFDELTATHANITGVATVGTALDVNGTLDVDGDTQLDDLNVSGVSTFSSLVDVNNRIDVIGGANVDQVNVSGISTFTGNADFGGNITVTSTDTGSSAAPEFKLYRDSSSPANADYLGQIKFAGESSTGVERNYAKITGKILDSTNGVEDGILEFAHIKNGSQNISARFRSDSLQLLNGTNFSVNGNTELEGTLDVDGTATFDDVAVGSALTVTGIGTFQSDLYVAGNLNVIGDIVYDEVTGKNINITGVATIANLDVNGPMDVDGDTQLDDLNVSGVATFSQLVDVNNRIDVVGGANLDQLNVTGVATFSGITTFTQSIFVDGDLNVTGDLVYDEATAENLNVTGIATIASLQVTDLTDNRVVIAGAGGELEDDANFTFNGTKLSVGVELDVDGQTELDELRVAGVSTFVGMSTFTDTLSANTLSVAGVSTFVGIGSFFSDLYVGGNLNVVGDLVYDEVTGRNINITGISTFEGETNLGIGGTTLTALTDISRVGINSIAPEYTLDVHGDINSSTDVKIGGVSILSLTASTDDVVALAIALG